MQLNPNNRVWDRAGSVAASPALNLAAVATAVVVYGFNKWVLKPNCDVVFVHSYLNDLLAMPFMLAYSNLLIGICRPDLPSIADLKSVGLLTLACFAIWEGLAPLVVRNATADIYDLWAYAFGAAAYLAANRLSIGSTTHTFSD